MYYNFQALPDETDDLALPEEDTPVDDMAGNTSTPGDGGKSNDNTAKSSADAAKVETEVRGSTL